MPLVAQNTEFAPIGARWIRSYSGFGSISESVSNVIGDILILGKICRIIQTDKHIDGVHYYNHFREYVYTQGDSVYHYINGGFQLLYNFNAQVGDVWHFSVTPIFSEIDTGSIQIDSIGTELIDGIPLRYLWVSKSPNSCYGYYYPATKITERIGAPESLSPDLFVGDCGSIVEYYDLTKFCYQDADLFYGDGDSCVYVIDVQIPTVNHTAFNCRYNALSAELILTMDEATAWEGNFALYDLQGRVVATQPLHRQQATHQVPLPQLPAGIYPYTFSDHKGLIVQRGKVVVAH